MIGMWTSNGSGVKVSAEDDARFEQEYPLSNRAVNAVAVHLRLSGNDVVIIAAADFVPRQYYRDNGGDLLVRRCGSRGDFHVVEVKGRTFAFTGQDDFPFPSIIIDRVKQQDAIVALYVTVNSALTVGAFVSGKTRALWQVRNIPDHRRGYGPNPQLLCPTGLAKFVRLKIGSTLRPAGGPPMRLKAPAR